ncbi:MAG: hypothetical protein A2655_03890 [Candidatus Yanofskybacteria bacterium RIFCSPHIGHO2_01_FULL_43_42]|uniref:Uncharacterized protein n=1 Tax=Candidatus Yanofskybacteria bacterium RIFCSPLOWO2_01_FULL_43_22 TaxID=1802695 RepID=A0A1F8GK20_9BACT|nr:MAG: hypothetical protein A2655_03890 [Candidatus Yanofskybacteria bacterium RIFCSPHIGHO2_01_FULL_43_42]OGN13879.1 MAG: hypothetical protein A3D48_00010 [Candidatus Yanofskybacteria bacterium RIFCSPHIGHO2_02_FULL_43_17]OGN25058.1 MAG: hypothetical protein A3A13_03325 [Candidatus Yanofskybacteria bacterium RIFCSPLOWO2_01_FULL_43_22]
MPKIVFKIPEGRQLVLILAFIGLANLLIWVGGPRFVLFIQDVATPFSSRWAAVYLTNGEVYVGHIRGTTRHVLKLSDAYVVNVVKTEETSGSNKKFNVTGDGGSNLSLIRWGFYQPLKSEGELFLSRSNILFWEKLDKDSEVVKQLEASK